MFRTQCVLSLLLLYAGLVHSFDWEIVTRLYDRLQFYDINGTLTHTQVFPWVPLGPSSEYALTYDPVHNRVLFAHEHNIFSFDIASKTIETLVRNTTNYVTDLAYDPVLEILFWTEDSKNMYSTSLKPGLNNRVGENHFNLTDEHMFVKYYLVDMNVDICGGFLHWTKGGDGPPSLLRARFDGSQKEDVLKLCDWPFVIIDQNAQKMYWTNDCYNTDWVSIKYSDLDGKNTREALKIPKWLLDYMLIRRSLTVSKDQIYSKKCDSEYLNFNCSIWKIPKNAPTDTDVLVESKIFIESADFIWAIDAKYNIEDQNCERVKSLLPNNSVTNVATDVSLLCVHGTKVSEESRCEYDCRCNAGYTGTRCEVNACQGYCLNDGVCSLNENREPVCQCTANYTGVRCEVNPRQGYCQNGGLCSLNENREPVCQCTAGYEGGKCDVSKTLVKCIQSCIQNTDVTSRLPSEEGVKLNG